MSLKSRNRLAARLGRWFARPGRAGWPQSMMQKAVIESLESRILLSTYQVTNTYDVSSTNPDYTGSLRWAIAQADANSSSPNTIDFESGVVGTISLTAGLGSLNLTAGNTTILGPGATSLTINAGGHSRVFSVSAGVTADIEGLRITGGNSSGQLGAGILNVGQLSVSDCTITGNTGGGIGNSYSGNYNQPNYLSISGCTIYGNTAARGAGVDNSNGGTNLSIDDCTISGNTATNAGGGIYNYANLSVSNSTITDNSAKTGGGLFNYSNASIRTSYITDNHATGGSTVAGKGGGIYSRNNSLDAFDCTISGNTAALGGGLYSYDSQLTALACTISYNSADQGGGIFTGNNSGLSVTNSTLSGNTANNGGGIYISGATVTVSGSPLSGNSAVYQGGGIDDDGINDVLTVTYSSISGNTAGDGGGISDRYTDTLNVSYATITNNAATYMYGGGIYNNGVLSVSDCTISGNSAGAGGGIYNQPGATASVYNSTFTNNRAYGGNGGGGIGSEGYLTVVDSLFNQNHATNGAGIDNNGSDTLQIANSTLYDNTASAFGGGIAGTVDATDCTITGNVAASIAGGGGLASSGSTLNGTIVVGNTDSHNTTKQDIFGFNDDGSNNLIGSAGSTGFSSGVDSNSVGISLSSARLAPLGNYDGHTQTIALLPGSPALEAGATFNGPDGNPITTDQRGIDRPQGSGAPDIGAFESQGFYFEPLNGSDIQEVPITDAFSNLAVQVFANDPNLTNLAGGVVTFTAPTSGASAILGSTTAVINSSNQASVSAAANSLAGNYDIIASAAPTVGSTEIFDLTNDPDLTHTALALSSGSSIFGQSLALTATVDVISPGSGTPTGTVTFFDGTTSLGSAALNSSGVATLDVSTLIGGDHSITADYSGDGSYATSASTAASEYIGPAPTSTSLSPSTNPGVIGASVSFTATVTSDAGTGTGAVVFYDGSELVDSAPLDSSGEATFTTTDLALGDHSISAIYVGDGNFASSSSSAVDEAINPPAPGAPSSLSAATFGDNEIDLSWTDQSGGLAQYVINRATGSGGTFSQIAILDPGTTSYADLGLTPDTTYEYQVYAADAGGPSSTASTSATLPTSGGATLPSVPTDLSATAGGGRVDLSWVDTASDETGFKLQRKTGSDGSYNVIATLAAGVTAYADLGLAVGTDYFYRIVAYSSGGDSDFSNTTDATPTATSLPFSDSFSRGDNSNLGEQWNQNAGAFSISSDAALSGGGFAQESVATVNGFDAADVSVSATLDASGMDNNMFAGVAARVGGGSMYVGAIEKGSGNPSAYILRFYGDNPNPVILASASITGSPSGTLTFEVIGNALGLYLNGSLIVSVRDSTITTSGGVGIYAGDAGAKFTNFSATSESSSSTNATFPFTDSFDRSDNLFIGSNWSVTQGDFVVAGDALTSTDDSGQDQSMATVNGSAPSDVLVSANVNLNGGAEGGVAARAIGEFAYFALLQGSPGNYSVNLYRSDGNGLHQLDGLTVDSGSGTVSLEIDGATLLAYFNNRLVAQANNTSLTSGAVGVYSSGPGVEITDFSAAADVPPTASTASLPFTDDFARSASTFLGPYWTEQQGNFAVSDNSAVAAPAGESSAMVNGISASDVAISTNINLGNGTAGIDARITGDTRYRGEIVSDGGGVYTAEILRETDGIWDTAGPLAEGFSPTGSGTLQFALRGSSLDLYMNGVPVAMATDSTISGPGGVGVYINAPDEKSLSFTDFSVVAASAPPSPVNATLPFSDNFTRANSTLISDNWTVLQGNAAVADDSLQTLSDSETEAAVNGISAANVDVVADVNMQSEWAANVLSGTIGLDARVSGNSEYRGQIRRGGNGFFAEILAEVDGSWTTIASLPLTWAPVNGRYNPATGTGTLRFDLNGSQIGLYLNDALIASANDSLVTAAGTVGVDSSIQGVFNNFSAQAYVAPTPVNASLTFDDNFNRADNTVVIGPSWVEQAGDVAVWNNQLFAMATGNSIATLLGVDQSDAIVSGQVNVPAGQAIGLVARYSGPGDANYYEGDLSASGGAEIWKNVDGTRTRLASAAAPATSGTLRFEVVGDLLQLFLNDTLLASATDSSITGPGSVGVAANSDGTAQPSLDNFDARTPGSVTNAWLALPTQSPSAVDYWEPGVSLTNVAGGDFDGDGKSDLVGFDPATGNLLVGLSGGPVTAGAPTGTTGFTTQVWGNLSPSVSWTHFTVGDFNGDGLADVAAFNPATGAWEVAISNGKSFTISNWGSWSSTDNYQNVVAGDFNGDGRTDLAAWDVTTGTWTVALSTGTGFATSVWGTGTAGATWANVSVGDFNGDGRQDLAAFNSATGDWHVESSDGSHFNDAIWATWDSSVAWTDFHVGDFNGDGKSDLIAHAPGSSSWQVALSTGSAFTTESWGTQADNLSDIQVGDFNGDGKTDLAGLVTGTRQWNMELSTGSDFTDQYWLTTSAAVSLAGASAGNLFGLTRTAAQDFEAVYNSIQYEPYSGEMKGPTATLQTGRGNDWDQDALLVQMLNQSGIQTEYVSGVISVPVAEVLNWLSVKDVTAAMNVMTAAGLSPTVLNAGESDEQIEFDHTWIQAYLAGPSGLAWEPMDPSFKSENTQAGISGLSASVPFDQTDYLAHETSLTPLEYYEDQVINYLAGNDPGQSIADVPYGGPIVAKQFTSIPPSLPYTVVSSDTPTESIPASMQDRVVITLLGTSQVNSDGTLFWPDTELQYELTVPDVSLATIAITYTPVNGDDFLPELRVNGVIVAAGEIPCGPDQFGKIMELTIDHYNPGNTSSTPDSTGTYVRDPGLTMAIGLDADQFSNASIIALQTQLNAESLAVESGTSTDPQRAFDDGLSLAMMQYFKTADEERNIIAGLFQLTNVHPSVGDGVITSDPSQLQYDYTVDVPISSEQTSFDIGAGPATFLATTGADGQHDDRLAALELVALNNSDLESQVLATVFSAPSVSAVEGIQWASDQSIPILTFTEANESEMSTELHLSAADISYAQSFVDQGDTVTIPQDTLNMTDWSGTVFIAQKITGNSFFEGDAVLGSYPTHGSWLIGKIEDWFKGAWNAAKHALGDPVEMDNGDFTRTDTDVTIPNIGFPLEFTRNYISGSTLDIGLGAGWTDSYSDTIATQTDGDVLYTDSQGQQYTFTPNGAGGFIDPDGLFGTLTLGTDGYVFTAVDGTARSFNSAGRLEKISDLNGNALLIAYDESGNLLSVTDANDSSRYLSFTSSNGHITSMTDFTGRTWTYSYQTATSPVTDSTVYLLSSRTTPSDTSTPATSLEYGYADSGPLFGLMTSITDSADGKSISVSYYPNGAAYSVTDPQGNVEHFFYDPAHNSATYIDALGNATINEFNSDGFTIKQINPDQTQVNSVWSNQLLQSQTNAMGQTESFTYDSSGNVTQSISYSGIETDTQYNSLGEPTQVTQPGGRITHYAYDSDGNLTSMTDAAGDETTFTYTSQGLVESLTKPNGNVASPTGNFATTFTYNEAGQVLTATTGLPSTVTNTYDDLGDLTSTTDATGHTTSYAYDILGRPIQITAPDPDGSGPLAAPVSTISYIPASDETIQTDPLGNTTETFLDGNNNVVKTVESDGTFTTNIYDAGGNLIESTDERGNQTLYVYDANNRLIQTVLPNGSSISQRYNANGEVTSSTDADGNTTTYAYDADGRLSSSTDPLGNTTTYTYDSVGDQTSITDADGNTTSYTYDDVGRVLTETNALDSEWTYTYDADGNLISTTDADGRTIKYTYDDLDRQTAENWMASDGTTVLRTIAYTYDAAGRLLSVSDPDATYTYSYDDDGRLTAIDNSGTPDMPDVVLNQTYDSDGDRLSLSATVAGTTQFTNDYQYDPFGDITQVAQSGPGVTTKQADFAYDVDGDLSSMNLSAGSTGVANAFYTYDSANQLSSVSYTRASDDSAIAGYTYTYDANGQITSMTLQDGTIDYVYDKDGQLTSATGSGLPTSESYSYDATGNQTAAGDSTGTDNQLTSDGTHDYAYDADGNLITKTTIATGATENFTWDYRNRLTEITYKNSAGTITGTVQYTYDPLNRRISQTVTNGSGTVTLKEHYIYDGNALVQVLDGSGNVTHTFLNGPAANQPLADDAGSGNVTWMLADQQGTVRDVIDSTGAVVDHLKYDSYGNITNQSNPSSQPRFTYAGMQLDAATGLYYDHARYYDPSTGRFISQDPIGFRGGTANLYDYVSNDPINLVDPLGLWSLNRWLYTGDGNATDEVYDAATTAAGEEYAQNAWILHDGLQFIERFDKSHIAQALDYLVTYEDGGIADLPTGAANGLCQSNAQANAAANSNGAQSTAQTTFQTYTKTNPDTNTVYSGRTSGTGTPEENVADRDAYHEMNDQGYGPAVLDKSSSNPDAIRGREQDLIWQNGGAQSEGGTSGNAINAISPDNPNFSNYINASEQEFGIGE
jgi:RHS repeat-associated protein